MKALRQYDSASFFCRVHIFFGRFDLGHFSLLTISFPDRVFFCRVSFLAVSFCYSVPLPPVYVWFCSFDFMVVFRVSCFRLFCFVFVFF